MKRLKTAVFTATLIASTQVWAGATVTGTVKFAGEVPNLKVINMSSDPKCVANNQGKEVKSEALVMGVGNTLANVFVKVKAGLPAGATATTPTEPVVIDQKGCRYIPHVIAAMKDQPVKVLNSDGTLHNIHGMPTANAEFNVAMPAFKKEMEQKFSKVEDPFRVKCDVHPWMEGFIAVMDHPYFSVSKEDGKYEIKNLPAGTYDIEIWHEKLGVKTEKVTVADGETKTLDISLERPAGVAQLDAVMLVK